MPQGGLVLLVASTGDSIFGAPRADYFVSGDDVVLAAWALTVNQILINNAAGIALTGGLSAGDRVQLYWYPTLDLATYDNGAGMPGEVEYGTYRHDSGLDGSAPWVIPADGSTVSLIFRTESFVGSNANDLGIAGFTVAPVPEASNMIFGALALGLVAFRVVPRLRRKLARS